jgi:hypothetical protein
MLNAQVKSDLMLRYKLRLRYADNPKLAASKAQEMLEAMKTEFASQYPELGLQYFKPWGFQAFLRLHEANSVELTIDWDE